MRKNLLMMCVCFSVLLAAFCQSETEAADIWIYTNGNGTRYYLRDYGIAARSWCFAKVVTVDERDNATNLLYRFESLWDSYSVYYGTKSYDAVKNGATKIESGKVSENVVASIIWNNYIGPMDAERWARIESQNR